MKTDLMGVSTPNNREDEKHLLNESKEVNGNDLKLNGNQRSFGLLDLWNIQKRQRTLSTMRRRLD